MSRKSDKEFLIRVRADIKQAVGELKQFSGEMKKTGADGKKAAGGVSKLEKNMNQLVLVAKVYVALKIARGLILQADAFQVLQTRIKTATKETGDYVAVSKQIYAISQRNGTELRTTTELFQSIARAAPELQATNKQVLGVVDSVSQLGIISGASKANLDAGLLQFSQGLSTGIFRAEEFNSLLENIPEVAKRIAEGMGKTTGELRNAIIAGDVLSKDVFESLQKQAGDITAEFEGIDDAVTRNETKIVSAFSRTLDAIDSVLHVTDIYNFFLNLGTYLLDGISNTINDLSFDEFNDQLDDAVFHVEDLIQRFDELKTVDFNNGLDLIDEQLINIQNELKAIVAFTPHVNILPDEQEKINVLTGQLKHLIGLRKILVDGSKNPVDQPAAEEADKSIAAIDKTIAALQEQADTFGLSNNAVTLHRLHLQGASNDQLLLAHAIVKVIDEKTAEAKAMAEGNQVFEQTRTAHEKLYAEADRLNHLIHEGAIDWETYSRAMDQVDKKLDDLAKSDVWKELRNAVKGWGQETAAALAEMTVTGEDLWKELADSIIKQILRIMYYQSLVQPFLGSLGFGPGVSSPVPAGGSGFGGSVQVAHTGGIAGGFGGTNRVVSMAAFANARRYHTGGLAGFKANEVPIVAELGEELVTTSDPRHRNNMGGQSGTIKVEVSNKGGAKQTSDVNVNRNGSDIVVGILMEDMQTGGPVSRSFQKTFNLNRSGR